MASVKKYTLLSIFISFLAIFGMSHNASALTPVIDLNYYDLTSYIGIPYLDCTFSNFSNISSSNTTVCSGQINGAGRLNSILTHNQYQVKQGDIINFYLFVYGDLVSYSPKIINSSATVNGWQVIQFHEVSSSEFVVNSQLDGIINMHPDTWQYDLSLNGLYDSQLNRIYEVSLRAISNQNTNYGLNAGSGLFIFNGNDLGRTVNFSIRSISHYTFSGSEENKEQEEKTQQAVNDSETAGSSSSESAEQGGASLLTAIGGFFSVITSASPTNCVFNAPLNTHFGNQRLNVDLCALTLPSQIGALTSIIAIGVIIPFAIHMFKKFVSLFRSFQS